MGKYAIYKYELSKGNSIQGDWTQGNEVVAPKMEHAYENFDHVFGKTGTEMRIQKVLKSGGGDTYPCHVLVHDRNIILLRLENVKKETIFEMRQTAGPIPSVEKKQIESYPPLHVLIDNRTEDINNADVEKDKAPLTSKEKSITAAILIVTAFSGIFWLICTSCLFHGWQELIMIPSTLWESK